MRAEYGNRTEKTWTMFLSDSYSDSGYSFQCGYIYQYDPVSNPARMAVM